MPYVVSIISVIISIISLILSIKEMRLKIGKQKIEQYYTYGTKLESFYFDVNDTKIKGAAGQNHSAVISLRIANDSAYPITFDSAYVTIDEKGAINKKYHDNDFSFESIYINETCITVCDKAHLPMTIQPFDVAFIAVYIPFFDAFVKRTGETMFPYLHLTTAKKTYTLRVEIPEYHALMSEEANQKRTNRKEA